MDPKQQEWLSHPWCVVACDSPTNGTIVRCRFHFWARSVGIVFRLYGWKVRVCQSQVNDPAQVLEGLKRSYRVDRIMGAFKKHMK